MALFLLVKLSILKNRHGDRMLGRVAQTQLDVASSSGFEQCLTPPMQDDKRPAGRFPAHLQVMPAELPANPCPKRLGNGFLGRETYSQKRGGIAMALAVNNFSLAQNALHEPASESFAGISNPLHFHQVNAGSENHVGSPADASPADPAGAYAAIRWSISFTAVAMPTVIDRLTMLCPMLSSTRFGTAKSDWVF